MLFAENVASEYKNHLEVFFEYLSNNGDVNAGCQEIAKYALSIYGRLKKQNDPNREGYGPPQYKYEVVGISQTIYISRSEFSEAFEAIRTLLS